MIKELVKQIEELVVKLEIPTHYVDGTVKPASN